MIDLTKPIRTRYGREVRIYSTNAGPDACYPVHGAILKGDIWLSESWTKEGKVDGWADPSHDDLVNYEPLIQGELFINIYGEGEVYAHATKAEADHYGGNINRVACKHLTFTYTRGEGL